MRGIDRRGGDGLRGRQVPYSGRRAQSQICMDSFHEVPGLQSVASARMASASINLCAGVYSFSASPKGVQGNATRNRIRFAQRGNICIGGLDEMICGGRAQLYCKRRAADVAEFVSVDLERESQRPRFGQDLARLLKVKGFVLAEDIHKWQREARRVSLPPFFEHWQHCLANEIGVALRVIL